MRRTATLDARSETPSGGEKGMVASGGDGVCEAEVINLTSSDDEGSGGNSGLDFGTKQRGDEAGGSNTVQQVFLPHTPRGRRPVRIENPADLTPNFRSAAAMAGWDDETLLMLAVDSPALNRLNPAVEGSTPEGPSRASNCSATCRGCLECRDRKRGIRTPGQAATPLSAARRPRRLRRVSSNEEPIIPIPMAVLNDEIDKCGAPTMKTEGSLQQHPSKDKENKNPQPCANITSLRGREEPAVANVSYNNALQLEKLREELTCVICLDICFEPSTTICGHSFCSGCLQSVYQKCGMRCPKCRQQLRATSKFDCPINTVLWNTIQLLFPQEAAARLKDQKENCPGKNNKPEGAPVSTESQVRPGVIRRISRPTPWRELSRSSRGTERLRPNAGSLTFARPERLRLTANNLTSFRRASEVLESGQSTADYPNPSSLRVDGYQQLLGRRSTPSYRSRQEAEDAALAARLQESFISEAGL